VTSCTADGKAAVGQSSQTGTARDSSRAREQGSGAGLALAARMLGRETRQQEGRERRGPASTPSQEVSRG